MMAFGLVCACSGTHEPLHDRAAPAATAAMHQAAVLDMASLLTLSIDELSQRLGKCQPVPPGFTDPTLAPLVQRGQGMDSMAFFRCRELEMVAAYDYQSRSVRDLLLLGSNENELMNRAQLKLGAENYLVLPVFQQHRPTELLGLRVLAINQKP